jgi:hypothetical protein
MDENISEQNPSSDSIPISYTHSYSMTESYESESTIDVPSSEHSIFMDTSSPVQVRTRPLPQERFAVNVGSPFLPMCELPMADYTDPFLYSDIIIPNLPPVDDNVNYDNLQPFFNDHSRSLFHIAVDMNHAHFFICLIHALLRPDPQNLMIITDPLPTFMRKICFVPMAVPGFRTMHHTLLYCTNEFTLVEERMYERAEALVYEFRSTPSSTFSMRLLRVLPASIMGVYAENFVDEYPKPVAVTHNNNDAHSQAANADFILMNSARVYLQNLCSERYRSP